jgi:circadian clock protein KaiB
MAKAPKRKATPKKVAAKTVPLTKDAQKKATLMLRLYVAGDAPNSLQAIANARLICEQHFAEGQFEIVDLLEHPMRGMADGIVVTPTLVRLMPLPIQRVIGNLSDTSKVLLALSVR